MQNFIKKNIIRVNRNLIVKITVILCIVSFFGFFFRNYFYNLFSGPFPTTSEQIYSIDDVNSYSKSFIQLQANDTIDTGYTEIQQTVDKNTNAVKSETTTGNILATLIEDKILLINSGTTNNTKIYTGFLNRHSSVTKEVISDLEKETPEAKGKFLNFYLDETDRPNWIGFSLLMILLAYGIWKLYKTISWINNPEQHPIRRNIRLYGNYEDVSKSIDSEIDNKINFNEVILTKSWILQKERYNLSILRLDDVVWVYKVVTKHSVNFIPTGKSYGVTLRTWRGQEIGVKLSNKESDELIDYFTQKMPYIIFGHSKEIEELWKKNPVDFFHFVAERKASMKEEVVHKSDSKTKENNQVIKKKIDKCPGCQKECSMDKEYQCKHCGEKFWRSMDLFERHQKKNK